MGIYVGRVILPDEDRYPAVCISNQTMQPYTLPARTEVGQANMAHVVKTFCNSGKQQNTVSQQSEIAHPQVCTSSYETGISTVTKPENYETVPKQTVINNYEHLKPVIESLPSELSDSKREEAILFIKN